jgi:hypothetical protein
VSTRRLRASLMAVATAAALSACGGDDSARTNHLGFEDGVAPAEGITFVEGLALYVLLPALILLTVAALVWLPGLVRASRYRPGRGWTAAPLWFGGPPDPAAAVEQAETGDLVRGGASGDW